MKVGAREKGLGWAGAELVVVLVAAAVYVATLAQSSTICTLAGPGPSVSIHLLGSDPTIPATGQAKVCGKDGCKTAKLRFLQDCTTTDGQTRCRRILSRRDLSATADVPDLPPGRLTVTLTVTQAGATRTFTSTATARSYEPNGEGCGTFTVASITVPAES
ncbi:hypothetical protein ASE12_14970 [Aeromicrobium sp. Root236]|uniref:hypothetical protein n=1 Tax=Aeromicrobium sp. Root236 TaxID=1736498 RepID=UPI0006FAEC4A|nr:hypothetical protein [Aeromicrobium sp. Root236]KRC65946.1 hypothetical protein ASE12_14970 [Aeromicrobium sp. Root236]